MSAACLSSGTLLSSPMHQSACTSSSSSFLGAQVCPVQVPRRGRGQVAKVQARGTGFFKLPGTGKQKASDLEEPARKVGSAVKKVASKAPQGFQLPGTQRLRRSDPNTVFVAGATGKVGSRTVRELSKLGFKVRAGVRNVEKGRAALDFATSYNVLTPQQARLIEVVGYDLQDPDTIPSAIGNAGKVVAAIGAGEGSAADIKGPYKVDGEGTKALIRAAVEANVAQFVMVSSIGAGKVGFPAALLNLFWGVLVWKRQAEVELENSGMAFTIVRPGGMERPTDEYKRTHNVRLAPANTEFGGQVSQLQVAEVIGAIFTNPEVSENKIVEVVAETSAPLVPLEEQLARLPVTGLTQAEKEEQRRREEEEEAKREQERREAEARAEEERVEAERQRAEAERERERQRVAAEKRAQLAAELQEARSQEAQARREAEAAEREASQAQSAMERIQAQMQEAAQAAKEARAVEKAALQAARQGRVFSARDRAETIAAVREESAPPAVSVDRETRRAADAAKAKATAAKKKQATAEAARAKAEQKAKDEEDRENAAQAKEKVDSKPKLASKPKAAEPKKEAKPEAKSEPAKLDREALIQARREKDDLEAKVLAQVREEREKQMEAERTKREAELQKKEAAAAQARKKELDEMKKKESAKEEAERKRKEERKRAADAEAEKAAKAAAEAKAKVAEQARKLDEEQKKKLAALLAKEKPQQEQPKPAAGGFKWSWKGGLQKEQDESAAKPAAKSSTDLPPSPTPLSPYTMYEDLKPPTTPGSKSSEGGNGQSGVSKAAAEAKKEAPKAAAEVKKEATKAVDEVKKEAPNAAAGVKKEATKAVDEVKKEAPKAAAGVKKEASKAVDEVKKEAPDVKKEASKVTAQVQKEAPKAVDEVKKEASKVTSQVQKEAPKVAEGVKKDAPKAVEKAADSAGAAAKEASSKITAVAQDAQKSEPIKAAADRLVAGQKSVEERVGDVVEDVKAFKWPWKDAQAEPVQEVEKAVKSFKWPWKGGEDGAEREDDSSQGNGAYPRSSSLDLPYANRPLSPYTQYPDLKPPTSPTPSPPMEVKNRAENDSVSTEGKVEKTLIRE